MALYINTNVGSLFAQRQLSNSQAMSSKALQRLSTGSRINSASDDAAGLAVATRFKSKVRSLDQASRNAQDAISVVQTAEGGLEQISGMLLRMRELAVQSSNGTLSADDRIAINTEYDSLVSELDRVASTTSFNGTSLIEGSSSGGITFQVGADNNANNRLTVSLANVDAGSIASQDLSSQTLSTVAGARTAMDVIDDAISTVATERANIGAFQNRLNVAIENIGSSVENLSAAKARIMDADIAKETANLTKSQILSQAGLSVVAQANAAPQAALSLIG